MFSPLVLLLGVAILEVLLWLWPSPAVRRVGAAILAVLVILSSASVFWSEPSVSGLLIILPSLYRLANLLRAVVARMNEKYLHRAAMQAGIWLIGLQLIVLVLARLVDTAHVSTYNVWLAIVGLALVVGIVLLSSTIRHLLTTRAPF